MKSDGTRRAIIIAVLCLFSIAMLFMTASAWGLKAFARFAEFMTGDRIFLRILAGLGLAVFPQRVFSRLSAQQRSAESATRSQV